MSEFKRGPWLRTVYHFFRLVHLCGSDFPPEMWQRRYVIHRFHSRIHEAWTWAGFLSWFDSLDLPCRRPKAPNPAGGAKP